MGVFVPDAPVIHWPDDPSESPPQKGSSAHLSRNLTLRGRSGSEFLTCGPLDRSDDVRPHPRE